LALQSCLHLHLTFALEGHCRRSGEFMAVLHFYVSTLAPQGQPDHLLCASKFDADAISEYP
jgi:hypothetical protein